MRLIDADKLVAVTLTDGGYWTKEVYYKADIDAAPTVYPPPNDPLTLDELREMGGEPYWHVGLQEDSAPPHWNILDPFYAKRIEDYGYGKRWMAYRRKPEEESNNG